MERRTTAHAEPAEHVRRLRARVDGALADLLVGREPDALYAPARYVLAGQGKRLRPIFLLLTAEAFGARVDEALPAALAVEVFHNFTLVHDDIMDHAATRRGRPTVHRRWDEATAVLVGDFLMALSYDLLTRTPAAPRSDGQGHKHSAALLPPYHRMTRRLCEGQALDKAFETRADVSVDDYLRMIDGKTGALLALALELGARLGGASDEEAERLHEAGRSVGRAFQIQDDLLDLTADEARLGKPLGRDLVEGKKTFLLLRALERAPDGPERAWLARAAEGGLPEADVPEACARMEALGVLEEARTAVRRHTTAAEAHLGALPEGAAARTLRWLIGEMQARLF